MFAERVRRGELVTRNFTIEQPGKPLKQCLQERTEERFTGGVQIGIVSRFSSGVLHGRYRSTRKGVLGQWAFFFFLCLSSIDLLSASRLMAYDDGVFSPIFCEGQNDNICCPGKRTFVVGDWTRYLQTRVGLQTGTGSIYQRFLDRKPSSVIFGSQQIIYYLINK